MLFGKEHVDRYIGTNGAEAYTWPNGTTILVLTTKGRKSGELRQTPLIFRGWGDRYSIVASKGGAPAHPDWYKNLRSDPEVQVQVKGDRFAAWARAAGAEERPELWQLMTEVWPDYDEYQQKTDRQIPVVVLERA